MKPTTDIEYRLEVLISTRGTEGISRVASMDLPVVEGVGYLVSWQDATSDIPAALNRYDLRIVATPTVGLSNNRNAAFAASVAPILLIADDDLRYTADGLRSVLDAMDSHLEIDIATFKHGGEDNKWFPDVEFDLSRPVRFYYVTSFEMAVRRRVVTGQNRLEFDPDFGLGAPRFHAAEEELFLMDALKAGYKGRFFPVEIVTHCGLTTGHKPMTPGVLQAQGIYIGQRWRWWSAIPRLGVVAWRHYRSGRASLMPALWHLWRGWVHGRG